jgi:membrane associated rhomboid family serine protease
MRRASDRSRAPPADVFPLKDNIPTDHFPVVTVLLIALNAIAYLFLQPKTGIDISGGSLHQNDLVHYGFIPYEFTHWGKHCDLVPSGAVACEGMRGVSGHATHQLATALTPFTAMFTHAGLLHLGGNMLFLWIFGNNVEDSMGPARFIVFYLVGGLAATGLQLAFGPSSTTPNLGASGAVAGVLGGYILMYPRAKVVTLVFIIFLFTILELPAIFFLGFWFAQQLVFGALQSSDTVAGGGVAYWAHVGGFASGLLLIKVFATRRSSAADGPRFPVY